MRRLFLFIMIALLPLRGWMGDVMAVEMASQGMNATNSVATYAHPARATGQFDSRNADSAHSECPGHAERAVGPAADPLDALASSDAVVAADDAANGHCNTCGVCQICHSVALGGAMPPYLPEFIPETRPAAASIRFASALAALGQKPPIS